MGSIGTTEAAKRLGVSGRRVAAMISNDIIKAVKVGKTWIIDEAEVERVRKLNRPTGRPKRKGK